MALPVIPVAYTAVASFIARRGVAEATKKYGPKVVKEAQEFMGKRQKALDNKFIGKKSVDSPAQKARIAEQRKVIARDKRLEKEMDFDPLELDELIREIPLKLAEGGSLMDEDVIGTQVQPVMQPEQPMMQGTPAPQESPGQMQQDLDQISGSDQEEAKQALMQIIKILQQMVSQGATDEQIEAFLQEVGITMEELQQAREMFGI